MRNSDNKLSRAEAGTANAWFILVVVLIVILLLILRACELIGPQSACAPQDLDAIAAEMHEQNRPSAEAYPKPELLPSGVVPDRVNAELTVNDHREAAAQATTKLDRDMFPCDSPEEIADALCNLEAGRIGEDLSVVFDSTNAPIAADYNGELSMLESAICYTEVCVNTATGDIVRCDASSCGGSGLPVCVIQVCTNRGGLLITSDTNVPIVKEELAKMFGARVIGTEDAFLVADPLDEDMDNNIVSESSYAIVRYGPETYDPVKITLDLKQKYGADFDVSPVAMVGSTMGWSYAPSDAPEEPGSSPEPAWSIDQAASPDSKWTAIIVDTGVVSRKDFVDADFPKPTLGTRFLDIGAQDSLPDRDLDGRQDWTFGHGTFVGDIIKQLSPDTTFVFTRPGTQDYDEDPSDERTGELHETTFVGADDVVVFDEIELMTVLSTIALQLDPAFNTNRELDPPVGEWQGGDRRPVVNISMGYYSCTPPSDAAFAAFESMMNQVTALDGFVVMAAGNEGQSDQGLFPAAWGPHFDRAISVGSVDKAGVASVFSNSGDWVEMYAEGENIVARFPAALPHAGDASIGGADWTHLDADWTGTSFAAPCVTALITRDPDYIASLLTGTVPTAPVTGSAGASASFGTGSTTGFAEANEPIVGGRPIVRCWDR